MGRVKYELGEYKLVQREGSPVWYRESYDAGSRKVARVSLRTPDFEIAKVRLREWYFANHRLQGDALAPENVRLADVIADYTANHAPTLASEKTAVILLRYWLEWWGDATIADVRNISKQDAFINHLKGTGLAINSVNRVLELGQAAIRRAWKRGVLSSYPFINKPKTEIDKPRGRPLEVEELRAWYRGSDERHWHDFMLIMLGTACRNSAALELTKEAIDFERGLIALNPEGRQQTTKRRPVIRLPDTLRERFADYSTGRLIMFHQSQVGHIDRMSRTARRRAGLDARVVPYSLRHTAARWMRSQGVPMEQIATQLGHTVEGFSMTSRYAPNDPAYLGAACSALECLLKEVVR